MTDAKSAVRAKPMYFVAGVCDVPLRHCIWGFFATHQRAKLAATTNETDIYESGWYPYALVAKHSPGMMPIPQRQWWFKWNGIGYDPIEAPDWSKHYAWAF